MSDTGSPADMGVMPCRTQQHDAGQGGERSWVTQRRNVPNPHLSHVGTANGSNKKKKRKATLVTPGRGEILKSPHVVFQPNTGTCTHNFNDFILSLALLLPKTSPFLTIVHKFQ